MVPRVTSAIAGMHTDILSASLAAASLNASTALYSVVELYTGYLQDASAIPSDQAVKGLSGETLQVSEAESSEPTFGKSGA